ncbi:MAG: hypothetical protein N4A38_05655 [Candidatus Gracilibacteria bacterium]|nr:hypothetical protein [Candidatus Gracilibacteria bacterium]
MSSLADKLSTEFYDHVVDKAKGFKSLKDVSEIKQLLVTTSSLILAAEKLEDEDGAKPFRELFRNMLDSIENTEERITYAASITQEKTNQFVEDILSGKYKEAELPEFLKEKTSILQQVQKMVKKFIKKLIK